MTKVMKLYHCVMPILSNKLECFCPLETCFNICNQGWGLSLQLGASPTVITDDTS